MYGKLLEALGEWVTRRKLWIGVIVAWILLAAGLFVWAPPLSKVGELNEEIFLPKNSTYLQTKKVLEEKFPDQTSAGQGMLLFYDPGGLNEKDKAYAKALAAWLSSDQAPKEVTKVVSIFNNPELEDVLVSKDGQAMIMQANFSTSNFSEETNAAVDAIRKHISETRPQGLGIYLTGPAAIGKDFLRATLESTDRTMYVTIALVIIVLLLVYWSPVAALVPLITIFTSYLVARGLLGIVAQQKIMKLSGMLDTLLIVLIFGAGTDYALFIISRFREEVGKEKDRREASVHTISKIGPIITASASTVIIGLLGMMVASFGMTRTDGPSMAFGIFITLLASLSMTPALLMLFGKHLFWPFHRSLARENVGNRGLIKWNKVGDFVADHPWPIAIVITGLLLLPYPLWPRMHSTFNVLKELPSTTGSAKGFSLLEEHFSVGEMEPVNVVVVSNGVEMTDPATLRKVAEITDSLAQVKGVSKVRSLVRPTGDADGPDVFGVEGQLKSLAKQMRSVKFDPKKLNKDTLTKFNTIQEYLKELGDTFPEVKDDPAYAKALAQAGKVHDEMAKALEEARLDNQLSAMQSQLSAGTGREMASPEGLSKTLAAMKQLQAYFSALGDAHPELKKSQAYGGIVSTLDDFVGSLKAMQQQALVVNQLEKMKSSLENPNALQGSSGGAGLQAAGAYLQGLGQAYPDAAKTQAYVDAMVRFQRLQEAMAKVSKHASVAAQLEGLTAQLQTSKKSLSDPRALTGDPGKAAAGFATMSDYLKELGGAFPELEQNPAYEDAISRLGEIDKMFQQMEMAKAAGITPTKEQVAAAMKSFGENLDGLIADTTSLQKAFAAKPGAIFFPKSLPMPPEAEATVKEMQTEVAGIAGDLDGLVGWFGQNDSGAMYFPPEMENSPEAKAAAQKLQVGFVRLDGAISALRSEVAGKEIYFVPPNASDGMSGMLSDINALADDLDALERTAGGKGWYFVPQAFLKQNPQLKELVDHYVSRDGSATQLTILLNKDPYSPESIDAVDGIQTRLHGILAKPDDGVKYTGYVGGMATMVHDLIRTMGKDLGKVRMVVAAGVFLVFVILLQSLIAPIYLVLSVLLSYGTTMGLSVLLFQDWLGFGGVNYMIPLFVFVLLVALGADYNILLISRIKEETEATGSVKEGVRIASAFTGGIITSAGIILAGTFAALGVSPIKMLLQIGVAIAMGVLVDTFIVRTLLVPAVAVILDEWNWWPAKRSKK